MVQVREATLATEAGRWACSRLLDPSTRVAAPPAPLLRRLSLLPSRVEVALLRSPMARRPTTPSEFQARAEEVEVGLPILAGGICYLSAGWAVRSAVRVASEEAGEGWDSRLVLAGAASAVGEGWEAAAAGCSWDRITLSSVTALVLADREAGVATSGLEG